MCANLTLSIPVDNTKTRHIMGLVLKMSGKLQNVGESVNTNMLKPMKTIKSGVSPQ